MSPSPTLPHQSISLNLAILLKHILEPPARVVEGWAWKPKADEFIPDLLVFDETRNAALDRAPPSRRRDSVDRPSGRHHPQGRQVRRRRSRAVLDHRPCGPRGSRLPIGGRRTRRAGAPRSRYRSHASMSGPRLSPSTRRSCSTDEAAPGLAPQHSSNDSRAERWIDGELHHTAILASSLSVAPSQFRSEHQNVASTSVGGISVAGGSFRLPGLDGGDHVRRDPTLAAWRQAVANLDRRVAWVRDANASAWRVECGTLASSHGASVRRRLSTMEPFQPRFGQPPDPNSVSTPLDEVCSTSPHAARDRAMPTNRATHRSSKATSQATFSWTCRATPGR